MRERRVIPSYCLPSWISSPAGTLTSPDALSALYPSCHHTCAWFATIMAGGNRRKSLYKSTQYGFRWMVSCLALQFHWKRSLQDACTCARISDLVVRDLFEVTKAPALLSLLICVALAVTQKPFSKGPLLRLSLTTKVLSCMEMGFGKL